MASEIEIEKIGSEDGYAVLHCSGGRTIRINTMDLQSVLSSLAGLLPEMAAHASATPRLSSPLDHLQVAQDSSSGAEILRLFLSPHVYHEYRASPNTNIARYFRHLSTLIEQDQIGQSSPSTDSRH